MGLHKEAAEEPRDVRGVPGDDQITNGNDISYNLTPGIPFSKPYIILSYVVPCISFLQEFGL